MKQLKTELVVLGSGPGGYSAAFRAADLGKQVVLVERFETLGGVCLNVGCIPSKTLLHAAKVLTESREFKNHGIDFGEPKIDLVKLLDWKEKVIKRLTTGLSSLAKQRKVQVITGVGKFIAEKQLEIITPEEPIILSFEHAIIAAGSSTAKLPTLPNDPRILDSAEALKLKKIPPHMLIIGGGIIGLEMATVYHALGSKISLVELGDQLVPGIDKDVVSPLQHFITKKYTKIMLETKVTQIEAKPDGIWVNFIGKHAPETSQRFDGVLVAIGRKPNGNLIGADKAGVTVDAKGFIPVNHEMRTNIPHIFAVGDIVGNPMLAHKAIPEGRFTAEVIAGIKTKLTTKCIPSVAYTDPEIATVGLTETQATHMNIPYTKAVFPWLASGRSLSMGRNEGLTKLLFDPTSRKILGGSIVGPHASELIAEIALAIELGATADKISHTIHPHPTLSETVMMASEVFLGNITDLFLPKKT